jgi:hypothetical protein
VHISIGVITTISTFHFSHTCDTDTDTGTGTGTDTGNCQSVLPALCLVLKSLSL